MANIAVSRTPFEKASGHESQRVVDIAHSCFPERFQTMMGSQLRLCLSVHSGPVDEIYVLTCTERSAHLAYFTKTWWHTLEQLELLTAFDIDFGCLHRDVPRLRIKPQNV